MTNLGNLRKDVRSKNTLQRLIKWTKALLPNSLSSRRHSCNTSFSLCFVCTLPISTRPLSDLAGPGQTSSPGPISTGGGGGSRGYGNSRQNSWQSVKTCVYVWASALSIAMASWNEAQMSLAKWVVPKVLFWKSCWFWSKLPENRTRDR